MDLGACNQQVPRVATDLVDGELGRGLDERAIPQYEATLRHDPHNVNARVYLADAKI